MNELEQYVDSDDTFTTRSRIGKRSRISERRWDMDRGPGDLLAEIRGMMQQLSMWRFHELETSSAEMIRRVAMRMVGPMLTTATTLFERVLHLAPAPSPAVGDAGKIIGDAPSAFLREVDRVVEESSASAPVDVAFIARLEMQLLQHELGSVSARWDAWRVIELCERIRRHIIKAITALRHSLGPGAGDSLLPGEVYTTELTRSIQVRRRHATFRTMVLGAGQMYPRAPEFRLRLVSTSIAILVCRQEYRDFRVKDRLLTRVMQRSILAFLRAPCRASERAEQIWRDVVNMVESTREINNRPELLAHDYVVLGSLASALERMRPGEDASHLLDQIQAVIGRDDALDRLAARGFPMDLVAWRQVVRAARAALAQREASRYTSDEVLEATPSKSVRGRPDR